MSEAVFVEGLTKAYAGKTVVDHLDLSVKSGTVFGLLGANGAGKSTTIECMLGTKQADSGTVRLLGQDPKKKRRTLFQRIGVQFQEGDYQKEIKVCELCEETASLYRQILPQYRKTRAAVLAGGVIYVATAAALHLFIGSLADWTSVLSPLLGREETIALIQAQYERIIPAMYFAYAGMILLILPNAFALLTKKTVMSRRMFAFHMIVFQIIFVLIPDIRQAFGAEVSTWDFIFSQGSGNAALCIWMLVNAFWAGSQIKKLKEESVK